MLFEKEILPSLGPLAIYYYFYVRRPETDTRNRYLLRGFKCYTI